MLEVMYKCGCYASGEEVRTYCPKHFEPIIAQREDSKLIYGSFEDKKD